MPHAPRIPPASQDATTGPLTTSYERRTRQGRWRCVVHPVQGHAYLRGIQRDRIDITAWAYLDRMVQKLARDGILPMDETFPDDGDPVSWKATRSPRYACAVLDLLTDLVLPSPFSSTIGDVFPIAAPCFAHIQPITHRTAPDAHAHLTGHQRVELARDTLDLLPLSPSTLRVLIGPANVALAA